MKLSKFKFKVAAAFLLPAALIFASCSEDNEIPTPNDNGSSVEFAPMTISADLSQPISKLAFVKGEYRGSELYEADAVTWQVNDKISVVFVKDDERLHRVFNVTSVSGGIATLSGEGPVSGTYSVNAVYPDINVTADMTMDAAVNYTINHEQKQNGTRLTVNNNALIWGESDGEVEFPATDLSLAFEHKTALLRFNVGNELGEEITIKSVKFSHETAATKTSNLNTTVSINAKTGELDGFSNAKAYEVTIDGGLKIANNAFGDVYMQILPNVPPRVDGSYYITITYTLGSSSEEQTHDIQIARMSIEDDAMAPSARLIFEIDMRKFPAGFTPTSNITELGWAKGKITEGGNELEVVYITDYDGKDIYMNTAYATRDHMEGSSSTIDGLKFYSREASYEACQAPWKLPDMILLNQAQKNPEGSWESFLPYTSGSVLKDGTNLNWSTTEEFVSLFIWGDGSDSSYPNRCWFRSTEYGWLRIGYSSRPNAITGTVLRANVLCIREIN